MSEVTGSNDPSAQEKADDARAYAREWRIWLGVAVIAAGVWALLSWRAGHPVGAWPAVIVLGVWAVILLAAPIFPKASSRS